ncbi:MAG: hypothetical protein PX483_17030 [Nostocales cyanobacterium LE14-WE4]|jgi:hypothetical protein|nr:hypothetical protein [Anabaena sp. 49633_E8]MCE2702121.1 hypothetical protein [Anabaena sp. 49633_E8]MDJ0502522.1 hypothetical protein [Nostocales cyanobacterium LE14-WE4]OBQ37262.1 MAG: hypothetical protein AN485_09815 [Anabaena sp. MDT14b]
MIDIVRNILHLVWVIIPIPMPWRNVIFVLVLIISLFWLIWRALPWLLGNGATLFGRITEIIFALPLWIDNHLLTKKRREKKLEPLWISYFLGDLFGFLAKIIYLVSDQFKKISDSILEKKWFPHKNFLIFPSVIILLIWHFNPNSRNWWYSFESWIVSGESKPMVSSISPEEFVRNYYDYLNNDHHSIAYNSLSSNFKKNQSNYNDYIDWWSIKVKQVNLDNIRIVSQNANSAIVDVRLLYFMRETQKLSKPEDIRLFLIWDSQNRTWLIDSSKNI